MTAQELKNSILQLAIQGKLVKQDPNDESASVLLEKIKVERDKLIKEKKIKKEKYSEIYKDSTDNHYYEKFEDGTINDITEEIPFEIPESWAWCRLNNITKIITGFSFKSTELKENNKVRVIRISDFDENGLKNSKIVRINPDDKFENYNIIDNSIVMAMTGGTVGKSFLIEHITEKMYLNQRVACISTFDKIIDMNYIYDVVQSPFIKDLINKNKNSTNDNISMNLINNFLIPLPCLNEQRKIVDKILSINLILNKYNDKYNKLEKLNDNYKDELKKSILQYAIQGKLVNQDSNDEPAEILINKILNEKRELIKTKQIKKENLSIIYKNSTDNQFYEKFDDGKIVNITDEIPFEIPDNWCWSRLYDVLNIARGGSPRPIQNFITNNENGINWIKIGDTKKGDKYINSTKEKILSEGISKSRYVKKGDLILSNSMSFGRPYILNIDGCIHDGWLVFSNVDICFNKDYLYYLLNSNLVYSQFCSKVSGAVINNLNIDKVKQTLIPIPPLSEQYNIVLEIEKIFDILKADE